MLCRKPISIRGRLQIIYRKLTTGVLNMNVRMQDRAVTYLKEVGVGKSGKATAPACMRTYGLGLMMMMMMILDQVMS